MSDLPPPPDPFATPAKPKREAPDSDYWSSIFTAIVLGALVVGVAIIVIGVAIKIAVAIQ